MKQLAVFIGLFILINSANAFAPRDSIGILKINGKNTFIHKVEKGDDLQSIAKKYNTTITEIKKINGDLKTLSIGQKINIPYTELIKNLPKKNNDSSRITIDESHANADVKEIKFVKKHTVKQGETLTTIATKYKTTVQQIIKWNSIKNLNLNIGQELIISGNTSIKSFEKWNTSNTLTTKIDTFKNLLSEKTHQVEEIGFAILSSKVEHSTLPVGSFIICTNPNNNIQQILQVEHNRILPNNTILGITKNIIQQLGIEETNPLIIIKYNQP